MLNLDPSLPDIAGMNRLPPYDYDQDEESVLFNINLSEVKMEDVSLGFSSRKVSKIKGIVI